MKITIPILGLSLVASVAISVLTWLWLVTHQFNITAPFTQLPHALLNTFQYPALRSIALKAVIFGFVPIGLVLFFVGDWSGNRERVLRGTRLVSAKVLAKRTRLKNRKDAGPIQVEIANVPVPLECEQGHFLLTGSTGSGKSVAVEQLLASAIARGDRVICLDPNGHSLARFAQPGDEVLNVFDVRTLLWSPFNEVRAPYDYERIAKSLLPDSSDPSSQSWHGYGQQLVAETMAAMSRAGENSPERLIYWLTIASTAELSEFLAGSPASGLFEPGAERALASTRFIVAHYLGPFQHLRNGDFSLRNWLESSKGNLYITWREDMLTTLRPLVSAWTDILMSAILTLPTTNPRPLWLVLDELSSHQRLGGLEAAATKSRKHGLRLVGCLQAISQLDDIYGHDASKSLRSCFRNILALGCSNADPETAQAVSEGLGQVEIERTQITYSNGQGGRTSSNSLHRGLEPVVLPSELTSLPPLHGYLKLSGNYPVAKIQLAPGNYPIRFAAFKER
jgi:hypothetical protein